MSWKYGAIFALGTALWSILALSSTLASEASRGSLDFVAVDAVRQAPDRAREAGRAPDDAGHRAGHPHPVHDDQLERLRRRRPSATRSRRCPRSASPCGSASSPCSSAGSRSRSARSSVAPARRASPGIAMIVLWVANGLDLGGPLAGAQPVPLDRRPHRARRRVRLGRPGPGRHRGGRLPRDRRRAVQPSRPRGHGRPVAARPAGRRARRPRADQPGVRRPAAAGAVVGDRARAHGRAAGVAGRTDGRPDPAERRPPQGLRHDLPGLRPRHRPVASSSSTSSCSTSRPVSRAPTLVVEMGLGRDGRTARVRSSRRR